MGMPNPIMAETYHILLIEKDRQVADDVRRFLRASAGEADFAVDYQQDLLHGQSMVAMTNPDAVIVDASFVDKEGGFAQLKTTLKERRIPMLILSSNNGQNQNLRDKADTAGAADYLLKNKLNYFYLPKAIVSAIKTYSIPDIHSDGGRAIQLGSHKALLERMTEAVLVVNDKGDVVYINKSGRNLLSDTEVVALLKRFISFRPGQQEIKANVEVQAASYDLRVIPQEWSGEPCLCIHLSKNPITAVVSLQEKISLISDLINTCNLPFTLMVNGRIHTASESFLSMVKTDKDSVVGNTIDTIISTNGGGRMNLMAPALPDMVTSIKGVTPASPLELVRKTISAGDDTLTICSLCPLGEDTAHISPHRLMEIASHDLREPIRTSVSYLQLQKTALY